MSTFLQSPQWAKFRASLGWKTHWIGTVLVLERLLTLGKSFLYAPEVELEVRKLEVRSLVEHIKNLDPAHKPIFFRLELLNEYLPKNNKIINELEKMGFVKAFEEVQPEWRQIVDLTLANDQLLAQMKPKGRYNISIAKRHEVKVKVSDDLRVLYSLYHLTSGRAQVSARTIDYFRQLRSFFPAESQIFVASYQGQPLAAALVIFWEDTAIYLYGGSTNQHRETMASYRLHWEIMREAKRRRCLRYDMGAVASQPASSNQPPATSREQKLVTKYAGLTRFKQQFGGKTVHIIGSYDLIFKPTWYRLYRLFEQRRRR